MNKGVVLFVAGVAVGIAVWFYYSENIAPANVHEGEVNVNGEVDEDVPAVGGGDSEEDIEEEQDEPVELPSSVLLDAPFTSQAPHANWDAPYQEACEEAAMYILHQARNGVTSVTAEEADAAILDLVAYEVKIFGFYEDTTAAQTAEFAEKFYDESYAVIYDVTAEDIKTLLAAGKLVAAPMAGQLLGNPNFTGDGPPYHFVVIRGYDDATQEFITNDVGTRNGKEYRYSYDTIMNALHDWAGSKDNIETGRRAIIISE